MEPLDTSVAKDAVVERFWREVSAQERNLQQATPRAVTALPASALSALANAYWPGNLDHLQLCAERMLTAGYQDSWGVGRHIYGSNYFHYVRDPWMGLHEFYWDIDYIPENANWEIEVAEASHESLFQWATMPPPEDFLHNYEPQQAAR